MGVKKGIKKGMSHKATTVTVVRDKGATKEEEGDDDEEEVM